MSVKAVINSGLYLVQVFLVVHYIGVQYFELSR